MFTVSGRLTPIELRILLYLVRSLKLKQYAGKYGCHDKWGHENATTQYDSSVTPGVHQNWKQISKNSSSGSANRSLKTTWQMFKKLFLKQSADWFFFFQYKHLPLHLMQHRWIFMHKDYDCCKAWRRVDWSPVFEFLFRYRQEYRKIRSESVQIARKYLKTPWK